MKKLAPIVAAFIFITSTSFALGLKEARQKNMIKELPSGYIKAVNPKAKALAKQINAKRKAHYEKIANETKVDASVVGQKAAEKIKAKYNQ